MTSRVEKVIKEPKYNWPTDNNDYGNAFYCTLELYSAKEWANKKTTNGFANKYLFDGRGLNVLDLTDKTKYSVMNWFAILMHFRSLDPTFKSRYRRELDYLESHYFIDVRDYDVVVGFRADDSYFKFPLMFVRSEIRLERIEDVYNLGFLGKQIAIISEKAFSRLKFIEAIPSEPFYQQKYRVRIKLADDRFEEIANEERYKDGTRMIDLVKNDDKR